MERLAALGTVLAFVSVCHTSAQKTGTVVVDDGRIGIGLISGGNFGPGSFSIGADGSGRPQEIPIYLKNDNNDGEHTILQKPIHHRRQQASNRPHNQRNEGEENNSGGGKRGNAQLYPAKPPTIHTFTGQEGNGGEASGDGQIFVGTVILTKNKNNKGNKRKNHNRKPVETDASALEAVFGSNGGNNGYPSEKYDSNGERESIQIGAITGGHFEQVGLSLNNKKEPVAYLPQKGSTVNNKNTRYPNTGNEALTIGHGANNNGAGNTGVAYNHRQINSGYNSGSNEEPWIWS